jgi:hypothetical protein
MRTLKKAMYVLAALLMVACSKDEMPVKEVIKSSEKKIIKFYIVRNHTTIVNDVIGFVDEDKKTIVATIPSTANIARLNPAIEISPKAAILPAAGEKDFSVPVTYTVTAEDGSKATYTVTISQSNDAPDAFELIEVENNAIDVLPTPKFVWHSSDDVNLDTVSYDLYVDSNEQPEILVAENQLDTTYTLASSQSLSLAKDYFWKVVAKDDRGGETSSEIFSFKVQKLNGAQKVAAVNFSAIKRHVAVVADGSIGIFAGSVGDVATNSVSFSSNGGQNWLTPIHLNSSDVFTAREYHDAAFFDNRYFVVGGQTENGFTENVASSADGIEWFTQDLSIDDVFTPRARHTATVHNNKMWVIGGTTTGGNKLADVWSSEDGFHWNMITDAATFGKRDFHQTVSFQGKLWVIGGIDDTGNKNDIWSSTDGTSWVMETANAAFSARGFHKCLVFDDKIWIVGGADDNGTVADIWYTEDGVEWIDATPENAFPANSEFAAVFQNNQILMLGGSIGGEIWSIDYHDFID